MHILIAPNAFKNSLDALSVAKAIGEGLQRSKLSCTLEYFPVGDGGDGTASLIMQKHNGSIVSAAVHDALGREIQAAFGLIDDGRTAVIGLADASGLRLLMPEEYDPLHTTTFGTGELVLHALDKEVSKIIICIGGSATVDGGTGILQALGIRFLSANDESITNLPEKLSQLTHIDLSGMDRRILHCELFILCDVQNYLLGDDGAAKIFGPQKGSSPAGVEKLEAALTRLRNITLKDTGKDMAAIIHGGAAGGVSAALSVFCNATLVNGIDHFLRITHFDDALQKADVVITGEGSIDGQTLQGKAPYGVAIRAKQNNIPVIGVAGKVPVAIDNNLQNYFDVLFSINHEPVDVQAAIQFTRDNLVRTGKTIGDLLNIRNK